MSSLNQQNVDISTWYELRFTETDQHFVNTLMGPANHGAMWVDITPNVLLL